MGPTPPALAGRFFTAAPPEKPQILDPHRLIVTIFLTFFRDASLLLQRPAELQCLHGEPERPDPQPWLAPPIGNKGQPPPPALEGAGGRKNPLGSGVLRQGLPAPGGGG